LYSYAQSRLEREADAFDRNGQFVYFGATGSKEGLAHPRQAVEAGQQGLKDVLAAGGGHRPNPSNVGHEKAPQAGAMAVERWLAEWIT
jgi:hypothetical protein